MSVSVVAVQRKGNDSVSHVVFWLLSLVALISSDPEFLRPIARIRLAAETQVFLLLLIIKVFSFSTLR